MAIARTIDETERPAPAADRRAGETDWLAAPAADRRAAYEAGVPLTEVLRSDEEIERLSAEIYERDIRPAVEADHHGEIVAIDLDSGCWTVADGQLAAVRQLRANQPDAFDVVCLRVGYPAVYSFGGRHRQRAVKPQAGCREADSRRGWDETASKRRERPVRVRSEAAN